MLGLALAALAVSRLGDDDGPGAAPAPPPPAGTGEIALEPLWPDLRLERPVWAEQVPGDPSRWLVVQQGGQLVEVTGAGGEARARTALDLADRVTSGGEMGLLGLAFHPRFADNGWIYVDYTTDKGAPLRTRVSRFASADGGRTFDPASEKVLLTVDQPWGNHNGGQVSFGPDGFLYVALGDGGAGGDPQGHGQNPETLLGSLLRLDVDGGDPYGVPADNPFAAGGGRPEIYAWGLRNPWRFSFDPQTGDLWAGDVGQNRWEEIDRVVKGGNYGWNVREGAHCFDRETCATEGLIDPVLDYGRDEGRSVTGGYVYRGAAIPAIAGCYVFGDFVSGRIWAWDPATATRRLLLGTRHAIASFGRDADGELILVSYAGGAVLRVVPGAPR